MLNMSTQGDTGTTRNPQILMTENQILMRAQILRILQSQDAYTGWRSEVPVTDRENVVFQLFASLCENQPQADLQQLAQAALHIEQKSFEDASGKVDYDKECNNKLLYLRDARARAMSTQDGPMLVNRSITAGLGSVSASFDGPTELGKKHQRQAPGFFDELSALSRQEYDRVIRMAKHMQSRVPPGYIEKIKHNLANMNPDQRTYLSRKGLNPVSYFLRCEALRQMRRKLNQRSSPQQQTGGVSFRKHLNHLRQEAPNQDIPAFNPKRQPSDTDIETSQIPPVGQHQSASQSQSHVTDALSNEHYNNAMYPSSRQSREGANNKPRLMVKKTISEDLCGGKDADRLEKLRKFQSCSKGPPFRGDRWKDKPGGALTGRRISKYRVAK